MRRFLVSLASGTGIFTADGIEHEGKLWIVPEWYETPPGWLRPARMIRFDNLKHQDADGWDGCAYLLNRPVPKAVLNGTSTEGFETLAGDLVPVSFPKGSVH